MPFGPIERVAPARSVAAANASALTPPYACMLRQAVQDAIVHLDHNSGTKNRLWVSTRWIAEVLCPGGLCAKDQRRALRGLQTGAIKGDKRLDQNERNAMLQTTLRSAPASTAAMTRNNLIVIRRSQTSIPMHREVYRRTSDQSALVLRF